MKIKVLEVIFRKDLYPRLEADQKKIQEYKENLEVLPPIVINQDNILIDGYHRLMAHKNAANEAIEANVEQTESENALYLRSIELNAKHGMQLSMRDKKSVSLKLYDGKNKERLVKALSVSLSNFNKWVKAKDEEIKNERNEKILSLYLQCKTQQDIADAMGVSQDTVKEILKKFKENAHLSEIVKDFKPELYNIWNRAKIDNQTAHFGNIPIEFIENLLYYYTEPFDVMYDPFAGGGITVDACKKWYRRYQVYDRKVVPSRADDIPQHDITAGLPTNLKAPNLVFLDPPYWKQSEREYSSDSTDLANMGLEEFYITLQLFIKRIAEKMNKGSYIALIIQATQWKNENKYREDHAYELMKIIEKLGFKLEQRIICPYSTEQYNAQMVEYAKKNKLCLQTYRDLVVFKK